MSSLKRKRKVSGLSLLFFQAVSPSLCLSFFGEDICLRQGWASLETWRTLALSATVAMERSRNGVDKSWMRKLMFQRGPCVGGVSGTTLVTNVKLFGCMTESENGRETQKKKTERESGEGERVRLWENSCESGKSMFLLWETELWEEQSQRKGTVQRDSPAGSKEEDGGCQSALTIMCSNKEWEAKLLIKRHETVSFSRSNLLSLASYSNKIVLIPVRVCQRYHHLSGTRTQN